MQFCHLNMNVSLVSLVTMLWPVMNVCMPQSLLYTGVSGGDINANLVKSLHRQRRWKCQAATNKKQRG